jgi:hypothetical protein
LPELDPSEEDDDDEDESDDEEDDDLSAPSLPERSSSRLRRFVP